MKKWMAACLFLLLLPVCALADYSCPHVNGTSLGKFTWANAEYTPENDETHHAVYDYAERYHCDDCNTDYLVVVDTGRQDSEPHSFYHHHEHTECLFCGDTNERVGKHYYDENGECMCGVVCEHSVTDGNGKCEECGYACPHANSTKLPYGTWVNAVYNRLNDELHHAVYDYADRYHCDDCGTDYKVIVDTGRQDKEPHSFYHHHEHTACQFCGDTNERVGGHYYDENGECLCGVVCEHSVTDGNGKCEACGKQVFTLSQVSFAAGGGSGTMAAVSVRTGDGYLLPRCGFIREGYVFTGWKVGNETKQPGDSITVNAATIVTAQWRQLGSYLVSFSANGGSGTMTAISVREDQPSCSLPACGFKAPEGCVFSGWLVGGSVKQPGDSITVSAATTVTAQWSKIQCIVKLLANNRSGESDTDTVEWGGTYTLPACTFTPDDKRVFDCWRVNGAKKNPGETITVKSDVDVVADWAQSEYTHTFNPGKDASEITEADVPFTKTVAFREEFSIPDCPFALPKGKQFSHWELATPDGGVRFDVGDRATLKLNGQFTAVWEQLPIVVEKETMNDQVIADLPPKTQEKLEQAGIESAQDVENAFVEAAVQAGFDGLIQNGSGSEGSGSEGSGSEGSGSEGSGAEEEKPLVVIEVFDVKPVYETESGEKITVTEENFPADGLIVYFDVPEGTDIRNFDFVVLHMITSDKNPKYRVGEVETLVPEIENGRLKVRFSSLSPVAIVCQEKQQEAPNTSALPKTGDSANLALWCGLLTLSGAAFALLRRKREEM